MRTFRPTTAGLPCRALGLAAALAIAPAACTDATTAAPSPAPAGASPVEPADADAATDAALAASPATTVFVAPDGDDARDGRSRASAVRTIQRGVDLAGPGDVVGVAAGTYAEPDSTRNVATLARAGTAAHWIRLRAEPGQAVVIRSRNWQGIGVQAPYVIVEGFHVVGALGELLAGDPARAARGALDDPVTDGNGIGVAGPSGSPGVPVHHVVVRGNVVEQVPGGGIYTYGADRVTVEDNVVRDCAYFSPYGNSGISLYQNRASDRLGGVHMLVRRNRVSGCENRVPFYAAGQVTDGNGIIVDDSRNAQNGSAAGAYRWRTRVVNNVVWDNGGRGIHVYASDHVDVVNNSTYHNSRHPDIREGELSAITAGDVRFVNNLAIAAPGRPAGTVYEGAGVQFVRNLLTGGPPPAGAASPANLLGVDPRLTDPAAARFTLRASSPARGAGTRWLAPTLDADGRPRPAGPPNIGAY